MAEIRRYKDCGVVFAEDLGTDNPSYTYEGTSVVNSPYGKSRYLDSTGGVQCGALDMTQLSEITVACKFQFFTDQEVGARLFSFNHTAGTTDDIRIWFNSDDTVRVGLDDGTNNDIILDTLEDQQWYSVVLTFDGTTIKGYIDGIFEGSATDDFDFSTANDGQIHIGQTANSSGRSEVTIKECIIDDRAWSEQEILDYSNKEGRSTFDYDKHIISNWNLDDTDIIKDIGWKKEPEIIAVVGNNAIDLGQSVTSNTRIEYRAKFDSVIANSKLLGSKTTGDDTWVFVGISGAGTKFQFKISDGNFYQPKAIDTEWHDFVVDVPNKIIGIDDTEYFGLTIPSSPAGILDVFLFANNTGGGPNDYTDGRCSELRWFENDVLVLDLIAIKAGDSIRGITATDHGMFDKISNTIHYNIGSGSLEYSDSNDGEVTGTASLTTIETGTALEFDGASTFVEIDSFPNPHRDFFSVIVSLKTDEDNRGEIFTKRGVEQSWIQLEQIDGTGTLRASIGGNARLINGTIPIDDGQLHNIAFIRGDSDDNTKLYVDSEVNGSYGFFGTGVDGWTTDIDTTSNLRIGLSEHFINYFDGAISKVIYLDTGITQMQVNDINNRISRGQL